MSLDSFNYPEIDLEGYFTKLKESLVATATPTSRFPSLTAHKVISACPAEYFIAFLRESIVSSSIYQKENWTPRIDYFSDTVDVYVMGSVAMDQMNLKRYIIAKLKGTPKKPSTIASPLVQFVIDFAKKSVRGRRFKFKGTVEELVARPEMILKAFAELLNDKRPEEQFRELFVQLFEDYATFLVDET